MLDHTPRFDAGAARELARVHFGIDGPASALTSERDQNFLIESAGGERIVLKLANALDDEVLVEVGAAFAEGQIECLAVVIERGSDLSEVFEADGEIERVIGVVRLQLIGLEVSLLCSRPLALVSVEIAEGEIEEGRGLAADQLL